MESFLRVEKSKPAQPASAARGLCGELTPATPAKPGDDYIARLIKMIPGEIVAAYTAGAAAIPVDKDDPEKNLFWLIAWAVFCGIILIVIRCQATKDPTTGKSQKGAVALALSAFVIWLYILGGPFAAASWYEAWLGTLMAIGWSLIVPLVYKGE